MDNNQVYKYLETLQEGIFASLDLKPDVYDEAMLSVIMKTNTDNIFNIIHGFKDDKEKERLFKGWKRGTDLLDFFRQTNYFDKIFGSIPTKFENPFYYNVLISIQSEIVNAIVSLDEYKNNPYINNIYVGTLPSGLVNARAVAVPGSENKLILFDNEFFTFASLFAKVVARAIGPMKSNISNFSISRESIILNLTKDDDTPKRLVELIYMFFVNGKPGSASAYTLEDEYFYMSELLRNSLESFAMGHEYGHIISGHLSDKTNTHETNFGDNKANEFNKSWEDEYVADFHGAILSSTALQSNSLSLGNSFIGFDFFMMAATFIERCISVLNRGSVVNLVLFPEMSADSHPPAALRMRTFHERLTKNIPESTHFQALDFGKSISNAIDVLWFGVAVPFLRILHADGVRPSNYWLETARKYRGEY